MHHRVDHERNLVVALPALPELEAGRMHLPDLRRPSRGVPA